MACETGSWTNNDAALPVQAWEMLALMAWIPAGASIYPDLAFTDSLILLPYTGGDKIGENNMCFYGLQYRE